jgi:hypothetical protein
MELFRRQKLPGGDGYKFVGCLLIRICNGLIRLGLGVVEQEICLWL